MKARSIIFMVIVVFTILGASLPVNARLVANSSPMAFDETGNGTVGMESTLSNYYTIEELVIIGGSHFLKGQSYIGDLSEKIELSDIQKADFCALQVDALNSLNKMYNALSCYRQLEARANSTPYNDTVIKKLAVFDYDLFQEKNGLVRDIFREVKAYLIRGDIRGVYSRISADVEKIYFILKEVQSYLYWGIIPNNETMWRLNQQCAKTLLFGQYVARVFEAIKQ